LDVPKNPRSLKILHFQDSLKERSKNLTEQFQDMTTQSTADLCDQFEEQIQIVQPLFVNFGGIEAFQGKIVTLRVDRDFGLVKKTLSTTGNGCVLVVDGGGAKDCALLGDRLAELAHQQNWSGIVINGCIRDAAIVRTIAIGVRALGTCPKRPKLTAAGEKNIPIQFSGVTFKPGEYLYADADGIIISKNQF